MQCSAGWIDTTILDTSTNSITLTPKKVALHSVADIAALSLVSNKTLKSLENPSPAVFQVAVCNSLQL